MPQSDFERNLRDHIADMYVDGGVYFWTVFAETPRAALAAFKSSPQVFGKYAYPFSDWPRMRKSELSRICGLLEVYLREHHTGEDISAEM